MPWANYCKKCKAETPPGEACPYCGGKLTKTGERLSFGCARVMARDWFAWNDALRVVLPAVLAVLVMTLIIEGALSGAAGLVEIFVGGFFGTLLWALGVMLAALWLVLALQGREYVHYVLDSSGVHACAYLKNPRDIQLYARLLTPQAVESMQQSEHALEGYTLIREVHLPWTAVRRVRIWPEASALLFFRPRYWQALAVRCPTADLPEAAGLVRKKMKRVPKAAVLPPEAKTPRKKRA